MSLVVTFDSYVKEIILFRLGDHNRINKIKGLDNSKVKDLCIITY